MTTYNLHDLVWSRDVPEPARRAVAVLLDQNNSLLEQNTELDKKLAALEAINAELLEALKQCDEAMTWELGGEPLDNLMIAARKAARAAIAKAEGETK